MIGTYQRFNMGVRPKRQWPIFTLIIWLASFPKTWMHRARIDKSAVPKDLQPPYFLLCNHNSFMDFMNMSRAIFPHRANYVVAIDGFIGREWLLRNVGCIGNRKFTHSISLVKNMLIARNMGTIVVLFPEARYSLCGTASALPDSVGKMVKRMNVPVVTLIAHGHHVNSPFWHVGNRGVKPVNSVMKQLISAEETQSLSVEEINARLGQEFVYDDFAWQKKQGIQVSQPDRAEGLHKVLYQCPSCLTEYQMESSGNLLRCAACHTVWEMTESGELVAQNTPGRDADQGATGRDADQGAETHNTENRFSHIPDWYEWQRQNVRQEVEAGHYRFQSAVRIESLPNAKRFVVFEEPGLLTHNMNGFELNGRCQGEDFTVSWPVSQLYACHIEYDYFKKGDCVDLNTNDDTFYIYPTRPDFAVTKIALATEELHRYWQATKGDSN
ncbi:MAG: 1-acyl-sn-glycerol-3-phosphate acyltransferase [Actinomycetia bacterium]|nr:1-acyl-sn-glycerol-3-phosphate acyltransferase [Actinomycetes bacterium]